MVAYFTPTIPQKTGDSDWEGFLWPIMFPLSYEIFAKVMPIYNWDALRTRPLVIFIGAWYKIFPPCMTKNAFEINYWNSCDAYFSQMYDWNWWILTHAMHGCYLVNTKYKNNRLFTPSEQRNWNFITRCCSNGFCRMVVLQRGFWLKECHANRSHFRPSTNILTGDLSIMSILIKDFIRS